MSAANTEDGAVKEKESEASSGEEEEEEEAEATGGAGASDADADADAPAPARAVPPPRAKKLSRRQKKKIGKKTVAAQAKAKAAAERSTAEERGGETSRDPSSDVGSGAANAADAPAEPESSDSSARRADAAASRDSTRRTKNPKKGVDLLLPVDYLSPELAQKMARNGHLSALSQGVLDDPAAFPTPEMESLSNASANAASAAGKKNIEAVLYASDALAGTDASVGGVRARPSGFTPSFPITHDFEYAKSPTPVFVMLPLDVISRDGALQHRQALEMSLRTLKKIGVEGVMTDVWWGIVERDGPETYDWTAYLELLDMVERAGLKLNAVMSFHACGANVGDYFKVTLPPWVLDAASADPDLFFTDQYGYRNPECISLWADNAMTLHGRTPLECYRDFMASFRDAVRREGLAETLSEVSVGCGPCGELRYPAYPENKISPNSSQWQFPGIGEFQCYDQRALGNLARAGSEAGHIEWGGAGPHDAGGYNNLPHETGFFRAHEGSWDSEYGQFFLSWYAGELVEHGDRMLRCARSVFSREEEDEPKPKARPRGGARRKKAEARGDDASADAVSAGETRDSRVARGPALAIKCAGVHWWYNSRSHAAELTAGYFNTRSGDRAPERDGYEPIVAICSKHGARLNFTCAEMRDVEHPFFSRCGPEGLLRQIRAAAARYGVKVAGENALCRFDQDAYDKIITNCRGEGDDAELWSAGALLPPMASFTFLRLSKELFEDDNFSSFVRFVARMANETGTEVVEAGDVVQAEEVLSSLFSAEADLLPGGLRDIRDETSSGFVAAQFSDL